VSEDQNDHIERKEERPEDVEGHMFDKNEKNEKNEEPDVEGHVLEKNEYKE
jgi:hypothetical protein